MSHFGISRAAVGRVVLEAAILGRIVRRRDNDAISQVFLASAVVNENGSRDHRRRSYTFTFLDDRFHVVRRQHFQRGRLRGSGDPVRVFSHIEWAVGSLLSPVVANGLRNRQYVPFSESAMQTRTAVSPSAQPHPP